MPKQTKTLADGNILNEWQNALNNLKSQGKVMLYANLINTEAVEINDMTVEIRFNNGLNTFRKELLQRPENLNILTKEIAIICKKPMQIKFEDAKGEKPASVMPKVEKKIEPKEDEDILSGLDIPINIIEEE